jgi:maleamate amidohydrolase
MKPMLLIIDMLIDFLDPWPEADRAPLVDAVRSLIQAFRAAGHPIIWVGQEFESDLSDAFRDMRRKNTRITIKGTQGCKIVPELIPDPNEPHVIKKRYSAFFGTHLDQLVLANAVDTVVLAGINTHACVGTTAIDAYQRDLDVIEVTRPCRCATWTVRSPPLCRPPKWCPASARMMYALDS